MSDTLASLKALADPVRLQIVEFLAAPVASCCSRGDGVCACDFEDLLGLSQPTVSHHMKQLVDAGLVRADKRGRWVYYELDREALEALGRQVEALGRPSLARRHGLDLVMTDPATAGVEG